MNFNGEEIIARCLDHLLAQTYPYLEIIVVDNHSTDGSLRVLERYLPSDRISVVRAPRNLGVPAGRNLGCLHARGDIVAFMDNDGYAHPTWLAAAVGVLNARPELGAVASVVFFNRRKIILNGAGGTVDSRGYGHDLCFNQPYELARFPDLVLYPMGCGMVVRRTVLERIGALDPLLFNYYDDTELGIRTWKLGHAVAVAPAAWVDHDFNYSDRFNRNKLYLGERNRIRTVLKYWPPRRLASWLLREVLAPRHLRSPALAATLARAWLWNLAHLPSALRIRARFACTRSFWHVVQRPRTPANNVALRPDPRKALPSVQLDGRSDRRQLHFGWYPAEQEGSRAYRWTEGSASALFRWAAPVHTCSIELRAPGTPQGLTVALRRLGELDAIWEARSEQLARSWAVTRHPCSVGPGSYELLLACDRGYEDPAGCVLGVAVASIAFE